MKRHTFRVIQWLGDSRPADRFGIVEVDQLGPVLRGGPYATLRYANRRAEQLRHQPARRREPPRQSK